MRLLSLRAAAAAVLLAVGLAGAPPAQATVCPNHTVVIRTASGWGAGTDADVQLFQTDNRAYSVATGAGYFEVNSQDTFSLCGDFVRPGVPDTVRLRIRPLGGGVFDFTRGDRWRVASITVDRVEFDCANTWLEPGGRPVDCVSG